MNYGKISLIISLLCLAGISAASHPHVYNSALAFSIASWIKPFATLGLISGLGFCYYPLFRNAGLKKAVGIPIISAVFFCIGVLIALISAPFSIRIMNSFTGIHSCVLVPSVISAVLLLLSSRLKKTVPLPFNDLTETVSTAMLPFYAVLVLSVITSALHIDTLKAHRLTEEYILKPALYRTIGTDKENKTEDGIYTGPLNVEYATDFIRLYRIAQETGSRHLNSGDHVSITDSAKFADRYLFVLKGGGESSVLLIFNRDGLLTKRMDNIEAFYHSETVLAAVDTTDRHIRIFDGSLKEIFRIPFTPTLEVKKIAFSEKLLAILYTNRDKRFSGPPSFCIIYRLDTGGRTGKIAAADIAPRLKLPGFITVDNTDEGLYITVLDRNSNKRSYRFHRRTFAEARIHQCGADRFSITARTSGGEKTDGGYLLVYDFYRHRRLLEKTLTGDQLKGAGDIIAVVGDYFLTSSYTLLNGDLREVFRFRPLHDVPHGILMPPDNTYIFKSEGSVSSIDFTPFLRGIKKRGAYKTLLTNIKGKLVIKASARLHDTFFVVTDNRVYVYGDELDLLDWLDFPDDGSIHMIKPVKGGLLLSFHRENVMFVYLIDTSLNKTPVAVLTIDNNVIWDVSEDYLAYGREFGDINASVGPKGSGILIAKNFRSGSSRYRKLLASLRYSPFLEGDGLFLPYEHITEIIDTGTGKRTVIDGSIARAGDTPYGVTNDGSIINLADLDRIPYRIDPDGIGATFYAKDEWVDFHGYLLNTATGKLFKIIRSGASTLGNGSVCSNTKLQNKNLINCIDLNTRTISSTFTIDRGYEIIYSDPDTILLRDDHSLVRVKTEQ